MQVIGKVVMLSSIPIFDRILAALETLIVVPLRPYIAFQSHHNLETNETIKTRYLSDIAELLKHCSVLKAKTSHPKRVHFSFSTVHADSDESNEAECANLSSCFSNSGETSRHRFPDVSATTPAFSVVAKAPIHCNSTRAASASV